MPANIQEALPFIFFGIAIVIALIIIFRASRRTTVIDKTEGDVLDEGAERAARNQALIDSPNAVQGDAGVPIETPAPELAPAAAPEPASTPAPATEPAPEPTAAPIPAPAPSADADDLSRIKGLGPKLRTILAEQGITRFEQIAAWSDADVARIDATLGRFAGRITRDQWVEQAKLLSADDDTGFSEKFGQTQ